MELKQKSPLSIFSPKSLGEKITKTKKAAIEVYSLVITKKTQIIDTIQGKAPAKSKARHPSWRRVRAEHLKAQPKCQGCGEKRKRLLEVHHVAPFHSHPEIELEPKNLLTLCDGGGKYGIKSCHLYIGHNGNFRRSNSLAVHEARLLLARLRPRPKPEGEREGTKNE